MTTTTLVPYTTLQGRLAAAYKDGILLVPGYPRVTVGDDPDVLIHKGKVTPTDTSNLVPYEIEIHEHIEGATSHLKIHCSCPGCNDWGKACKHAALTLEGAGVLRDNFTYEVLDGEAWKESGG